MREAGTRNAIPQCVFNREARLFVSSKGYDRRPVGSVVERVEVCEIIRAKNCDGSPVGVKSPKPIARFCRLQHRLCDEESEATSRAKVAFESYVGQKHRHVFLAAAQATFCSGKCKKSILDPQRLRSLPIVFAHRFPTDPRRIANYEVESIKGEKWSERIFQQSWPDAVFVRLFQLDHSHVEISRESDLVRGDVFPRRDEFLDEFVCRKLILDAELDKGNESWKVVGSPKSLRDKEIADTRSKPRAVDNHRSVA